MKRIAGEDIVESSGHLPAVRRVLLNGGMMMQFGMPTLIEAPGAEETAALCRALGLDFVELNMNLPQYQPDGMDAAKLAEIAAEQGIFYTVHLDENLNPADFNPYVARAYRQTAAEALALAKRLNMPTVNMHLSPGVYFTLPERRVYLFDGYRSRYLASMRDFRSMCEDAVGGCGVRVCVENCDGYEDFQRETLEMLLESPVFGLTFDVGHSHTSGGSDESFIRAHGDRLSHMHLHDALGRKNHLALGDGELDAEAYLSLARERGCRVVLETKTVDGLKKSVGWLRRKGEIT